MHNGTSPSPEDDNRGSAQGLQIFDNGEFNLEITPVGDSFTINAPGLARALGNRDANTMLANVPEDEKGYGLARTPGGDQGVRHVTEPGFYRLMGQRQAARIKNPEVKDQVTRFQRWVFHDVLPSIRKTGGYSLPVPAQSNGLDLSDPLAELERANSHLTLAITLAKQERDGRVQAEAQLKQLEPVIAEVYQQRAELSATRPKAEYVDTFVNPTKDVTLFRTYCAQIQAPEQKLRKHLIAKGIIYKKVAGRHWSKTKQRWEDVEEYHAHAAYKPWFHRVDQTDAPRLHNGQLRTTLYITPVGKVGIAKWLARNPIEVNA